jgi:hypothetical protein
VVPRSGPSAPWNAAPICAAATGSAAVRPKRPRFAPASDTTQVTSERSLPTLSAAKPPMLCPTSATRAGSTRCAAAKPGARTCSTTAAVSASTCAKAKSPSLPQEPR